MATPGDTMRAVTYDRYGGPEVLDVTQVERPRPASGQMLIRVEATEVSKSDTEMRAARWAAAWLRVPMRLVLGVTRPRRRILGLYFAGVVEEVGDDVDLRPGTPVIGCTGLRRGAHAEFLTLPARAAVVPKPASMTFAEAAGLVLGGLNGVHFVREAEIRPGESVLVNGAGGVIGAHAVQAAVAAGATVTGVDAAHKEAFVRSIGASAFVDYQQESILDRPERYDVVIDMVYDSTLTAMLGLLHPGGRYAHGNPPMSTMLRAPFGLRRHGHRIIVAFADENRKVLRRLVDMVDRGELTPILDRALPLDEVRDAHRLVDSEERLGAIVLAVGANAHER